MLKAFTVFKQHLVDARNLDTLHQYLTANLKTPMQFDDLLRFELAYAVSAFDKLIHDLVRIGMVDTFLGKRPPTDKYLSEKISIDTLNAITAATVPPKEYFFEQEIIAKLKIVSYQDPANVADGLSFIWSEPHKWTKIAASMGIVEKAAKTQLRLIVDRRNKIVHEADMDTTKGQKFAITKSDCDASVLFIERCGEAIVKLVA